jgi:NSS family neurotransmitter:Na+ symporter
MEREREQFGKRLATLFVMVGVAVGLGNVWRFPYMMGKFGGGTFLFIYILALLLFGIPALIAEWALGRQTGEGPPGSFITAGLPAGRWVGGALFITVLMATSYYVVVIGWVLLYLLRAITTGLQAADPATVFTTTVHGFTGQAIATWLVLIGCAGVILGGVRKGIERVSRIFTPLFFLLLIVLVIRSLTLPGAGAGVRYLFTFEPGALTGRTLLATVGQVFFSLALGGTFMVTYGAYLRREARPLPLAVQTAAGDFLAALLAALLVIPAVFSAGLEPTSGPPLLFETLPVVFARIPAGNLVAALFFLALALVAFLSAVAAIEVLVSPLVNRRQWTRPRAVWTVVGAAALLGIPSLLSIEWLMKSDLIWGSTMQPLGSLLALIAVGWCVRRSRAFEAAGLAEGSRLGRLWLLWIRYVVPIGVGLALLSGWLTG